MWVEAMNHKFLARDQNTWQLVGKKTIGGRWVYRLKLKAGGSLEMYKARLVAKGYTQEYYIDF